jgi:hypothetical protein
VIKKPEWLRKNLSSEEKVLRKKKFILTVRHLHKLVEEEEVALELTWFTRRSDSFHHCLQNNAVIVPSNKPRSPVYLLTIHHDLTSSFDVVKLSFSAAIGLMCAVRIVYTSVKLFSLQSHNCFHIDQLITSQT